MRAELSYEEKLNVLTHGIMAAAFLVWMCIGVPQTWEAHGMVAGSGILIFFLCMICMILYASPRTTASEYIITYLLSSAKTGIGRL